MQLLQLALLAGTASANPLHELFARQAPAQSSCTATFLPSCTGAASTSVRAWCTSQGFDRIATTVTRTNVVRRTVQSTITSYTSTLTVTLPTSTRTVSSMRTAIITTTSTDVSTLDRTTTVPVTGRISGCPVYVPPQPVAPEISEPPTAESSAPPFPEFTESAVPPTMPNETAQWRPGAKPAACVEQSRHVYADSDGQAYQYIRCAGHGDSIINNGNRYANVQVTSFEACAKFCRYTDRCQGFNWATNNPGTCNVVIEGVGRLQTFDVNTAPWYYHHMVDRTTAQPEQSSVAPLPPGCAASGDYQWTDANGVRRAYKMCQGYAHKQGVNNPYPYNWVPRVETPNIDSCARLCRQSEKCYGFNYLQGNPTTCNLLMQPADTLMGGFDANYPWKYYHYTGVVAGQVAMAAKRQATLPRPSCVRAANALQTTSACRCAIPSPTTTTISTTLQTTSMRTITLTRRLVSTTSVTPTAVTTVIRTSTLTRQRRIVRTVTSMHTEESTVTRTLEATPTAFYIADNSDEGARHFLEWPADEDEIYYHMQYDWDASDDEWAPTVFNLEAETLRVADLDNTEGALENYMIVAKNNDEDGTMPGNPTNGVHVLAMSDGGGQDSVACRIEATEDDQCALLCSSNDFSVNSRNGDGLWNLMSNATTEYQYTNYVFAANVELEQRSVFRKREAELRRAAAKAKKN